MTAATDARTRTRLVWTLFTANALSSTAFIGVVTVAPIVASDLTGSAALSGLPSTGATVGSAMGALVLGSLGARHGRRPTFAAGWTLASLGAVGAASAALAGSLTGFVVGLVVLGFGRSASQLARYAAGDLQPEHRRGRAISLVVWAATIGSVVGPLLIAPSGRAALAADLPETLGPYALGAVGFAVCALLAALALRPEPIALAVRDPGQPARPAARGDLALLLRLPSVRLSMAVLVTSQLVMVLVMTMTPVHLRSGGGDLADVGGVMMAHTLGMFALAPVTGWVVDRAGHQRTMVAGAVVLVASCLLAASATDLGHGVLHLALFGLGYGWNLGFVAASTHLQAGLDVDLRARIQGIADAATWLAGGVGSASSGMLVAATSYTALGLVGALGALVIPVALWLGRGADTRPAGGV